MMLQGVSTAYCSKKTATKFVFVRVGDKLHTVLLILLYLSVGAFSVIRSSVCTGYCNSLVS